MPSTYRIRASVLAKRAAVCVLRQNCRIFEVEGHTEGTPRDWFGKRDNPADRARYCVRDLSQDSLFNPPSLTRFRSPFYRGAADARCVAAQSRVQSPPSSAAARKLASTRLWFSVDASCIGGSGYRTHSLLRFQSRRTARQQNLALPLCVGARIMAA